MLATSTIFLKQFILTLSEFYMNIHLGERGVTNYDLNKNTLL